MENYFRQKLNYKTFTFENLLKAMDGSNNSSLNLGGLELIRKIDLDNNYNRLKNDGAENSNHE